MVESVRFELLNLPLRFGLRVGRFVWRKCKSHFLIYGAGISWYLRKLSKAKRHGLPAPLTVSLTSYPARFRVVHLTIRCLLNQSVVPDNVVLWIAEEDKDKLPDSVIGLERYGLDIRYCDDIKSYKKIIPELHINPDNFIVTADDDLWYWRTWLEELVRGYDGNPKEMIAHRCHSNSTIRCYRANEKRSNI